MRVHLQDVIAHAKQQLAAAGVEADARLELLQLALGARNADARLLVLGVEPAQHVLAEQHHRDQQQAQEQEGERLPATSLPDHDRPRFVLRLTRERQAEAAVGVLLKLLSGSFLPMNSPLRPKVLGRVNRRTTPQLPEEPERGRSMTERPCTEAAHASPAATPSRFLL